MCHILFLWPHNVFIRMLSLLVKWQTSFSWCMLDPQTLLSTASSHWFLIATPIFQTPINIWWIEPSPAIFFPPSFSIICYSRMYVTQYRRKDLLLLLFHHEFKGISIISRKNNLIDSWKVAVLIRQLPKHPKNCAGAEIRNSEQQLRT